MTADHEAQRQAADSQATDQGAAQAIVNAMDYALFYELGLVERGFDGPQVHALAVNLERIVGLALAEAGYTVVKAEWEYAARWYDRYGPRYEVYRNEDAARRYGGGDVHRRIVGPWVPVLEGSAEEAGGECRCEQIQAAYHGKPGTAGAAARAGVSTVCAVHGDLAEGSADRGSEEGGER